MTLAHPEQRAIERDDGFLDLLMQATADGVLDWDLERRRARYSERWKALLGYEPDELADDVSLWRRLSHPDDVLETEALLKQHHESFWPFQHTWRMQHRTGEWRWVFGRAASQYDDDGVPVRTVVVFSDVTDRVRAEDRHKALASAIPDTLLRVTAAGAVIDYKPSAINALPPPAVGESVLDWEVTSAFRTHTEKALAGALRGELPAPVAVTFGSRGQERWLEARAVRSGEGEAVLILRDITEQRKLESQLNQAHKLEAIGQLASGIAHEINTPMQYLSDNIHFLEEACNAYWAAWTGARALLCDAALAECGNKNAERLSALESEHDLVFLHDNVPSAFNLAREAVMRVSQIVRAMKAFSHPGTTRKTTCDLNSEVQTTITISANSWKYVADLETQLDPSLPLVSCVPGEVNQVILNLIVNAAQALGEHAAARGGGKGKIIVSTRATDEFVEVRVADNGPGIAEMHRHRIFEPFFTTKEVGKGTGQGLALARAVIVDKHHGTLDFETETGKGTTFIVRLPLKEPEEQAAA